MAHAYAQPPCSLQEQGGAHAIFCLKFNTVDARYGDLLATVCGRRATVYSVRPGGAVDVVQAYTDDDVSDETRRRREEEEEGGGWCGGGRAVAWCVH